MRRLIWLAVLSLTTAAASSQGSDRAIAAREPEQAKTFVRNLYTQILARAPGGLLDGKDLQVFRPYLGTLMLHQMALTRACARDWFRQNQGQMIKAPFAWGEFGLFSGANERISPNYFSIKSVKTKRDGTAIATVLLKQGTPVEDTWQGAAIVGKEHQRLVLTDIVYLRDKEDPHEWTLHDVLTQGCRGSHWVGYQPTP